MPAMPALLLQVTGTKAELMLRILGAFGFTAPTTTAPAQLLRALLLERSTDFENWDGPAPGVVSNDVRDAIANMVCSGHAAGVVVMSAQVGIVGLG